MKRIKMIYPLAVCLCLAAAAARAGDAVPKPKTPDPEMKPAQPSVRDFTVVNIEYQGSKVWVPGTLIAKKGEKVRIQLINKTPSGVHGFAIDEFQVKIQVSEKDKEIVEFTADKAGLFKTYCHMHPAHLTGQLLVLE
ncbi:MAG: cupredoxin domain-containing protein [Elusimicrobia bacterium]|nr:cupredoxin domain-containing protein [Elusimicrobiota bacterium]